MKVNTIIAVVILTLFSFCACTQDKEVEVLQERMLSINVDQRGVTRAEVDGFNTTFTDGDEIGIFIVNSEGNIVYNNISCTLNDGKWDAFIAYNPSFNNYKFFAYYPYSYDISIDKLDPSATTATDFFKEYIADFTPLEDQRTLDDYMASDLMTSLGTYNSDTGTVTFKMDHEMGLAIFNVFVYGTNVPTTEPPITSIFDNPYPYTMNGTDIDGYYLIVHPSKPVEVDLDPQSQQGPTSISAVKGKYTTYVKYTSV